MKRVRDLASTIMAVNSRRARVACVIPSRLSSTSSRRALQSMSLTKDPQGRDMERPYFRAFAMSVTWQSLLFILCLFLPCF
ncbi:unnamed protein product [Brassica oleracea]